MHALEQYASSVDIARRAGVPLHLAHTHLGFDVNVGREPELRRIFDEADRNGVDVTLDAYTYTAGSSYLHAYLPGWVHEGSADDVMARASDPGQRERIRRDMEDIGSDTMFDVPLTDWSIIVVGSCSKPENQHWMGRSIKECAGITGKRPIDFYCDLIVDEELGASLIAHIGNEDNIRAIMKYPEHTVCSDGILNGARPHPRGWGSFSRFLAHYTRDEGVLRWEEAVRKMTSLPARRLGFLDRGIIRPGMAADIVCVDPLSLEDRATYDEPKLHPLGIDYVIVNGTPVIDGGEHTGALPGHSLRGGPRHG
jgi:N-acyl-D-amino-acid deacylase